jgi:hypothetical protein
MRIRTLIPAAGILLAAATVVPAQTAPPAAPTPARTLDQQLSMLEREFVSLVEAMPADKFKFAPTGGEFSGVRTFSQQATHTAAVIYAVSAAVLEQKNPTDMGPKENGPASIEGKDAVVKYVKDAFAYGHKAMQSITPQNLMGMVPSAFGNNKTSRLNMATIAVWHSFDHYGQMVVYARMTGIVPPASR